MNPWISIWTEPKATIAKIVADNPNKGVWLLAWIYGFLSLMNGSQSFTLGNHLQYLLIFIISLILAPLWGMALFAIWSWVILMIGKMLKGQASFAEARAAFAWSCVPLVINIALWVLLLISFGGALFQTAQPTTGPMILLMVVLMAKVVVMIWSLVIYINTLAEVQQFSVLRSIANIALAWIAIGIVVALIWMGIGFLVNASLTPSQAVLNLTLRMQL